MRKLVIRQALIIKMEEMGFVIDEITLDGFAWTYDEKKDAQE